MKKIYFLSFTLIIFSFLKVSAQNEIEEKEKIQHHRIALFTGYTLISESVAEDGELEMLVAPTLGFDYEYYFTGKFALGLDNALELDDYFIEDSKGEILERDYSFRTALTFIYEPFEWWSVFTGPGFEYESQESFALVKIGTAFTKKFEQGWDVGITIDYDIKEENSSPAIGVSVGKKLGKLR